MTAFAGSLYPRLTPDCREISRDICWEKSDQRQTSAQNALVWALIVLIFWENTILERAKSAKTIEIFLFFNALCS